MRYLCFMAIGVCLVSNVSLAQTARSYLSKPADWFRSEEGRRITTNVLSHQADSGAWPKNVNTAAAPYADDRAKLKGTFDNRATTDELRLLARAFSATSEVACRQAFEKGIDHILAAQYEHGGWPQSYPPGRGYARHITFNDDCMVRLMEFVREVSADNNYSFIDAKRRAQARRAFDRGIECILKCQVKVDGKLTVWCAQHDELDFSPRPARTFEPASLSGCESVRIVRLLMSVEKPREEIVSAVESAVAWFKAAKLAGIKQVVVDDANSPTGKNKIVVDDPQAPPIWARFYEISVNRPLFVDRDGVPRFQLADIGYERRNGYAWLGQWPQSLVERDYPRWKEKR